MLLRSISMRAGSRNCPDNPPNASIETDTDGRSSSIPYNKNSQNLKGSMRSNFPDKIPSTIKGLASDIFLLVPLIVTVSLLLGTAFYRIHHGWELSTAFYFSAQVLAGCMYDMPTETDPISTSFSLMFFLFGSSAMAGAFGAFVSTLVSNSSQIASDARKIIRFGPTEVVPAIASKSNNQYEEFATDVSRLMLQASIFISRIRLRIGWDAHRSKYVTVLAALFWYAIGITYGVLYEGWATSQAFRFALGAMAASGVPPPTCVEVDGYDDCQLGTFRGVFVGVYVIVGVPLFAFTLGQFAGMIVERAIREREMQIMSRPLGESEFKFALTLKRNPKKVPNKASASASARMYSSKEEEKDSGKTARTRSTGVSEKTPSTPFDSSPHYRVANRMKPFRGDSGKGERDLNSNSTSSRPRALSEPCMVPRPVGGRITSSKVLYEIPFSEFSIDFGEFVVLEMLRLRRVDEHDLEAIRNLFDDIDSDNSGTIDQVKLQKFSELLAKQGEELRDGGEQFAPGSNVDVELDAVQCSTSQPYHNIDSSVSPPPVTVQLQPTATLTSFTETPQEVPLTLELGSSSGLGLERLGLKRSQRDCSAASEKFPNGNIKIKIPRFFSNIGGVNSQVSVSEGGVGSESLPLLSLDEHHPTFSQSQKLSGNPESLGPMLQAPLADADMDGDVTGRSDGSVNSGESGYRQSLTDEYNRLLLPILQMRHQVSSSGLRHGGERRPSMSADSPGNMSPPSVRRQSIDVDAAGDSSPGSSPRRGGRRWWGQGGDSSFDRNESSYGRVHTQEELTENGGRGPREHVDLEEDGTISTLLRAFGFSKYGTMDSIKEEN